MRNYYKEQLIHEVMRLANQYFLFKGTELEFHQVDKIRYLLRIFIKLEEEQKALIQVLDECVRQDVKPYEKIDLSEFEELLKKYLPE